MADILRLPVEEDVWVDPERLAALYVQLGAADAEKMIDRAVFELESSLGRMTEQYEAGDFDGFQRTLRAIQRVGDEIGMSKVSRTATDVCLCLRDENATALGATWARLRRFGDRASVHGRALRGLSGGSDLQA